MIGSTAARGGNLWRGLALALIATVLVTGCGRLGVQERSFRLSDELRAYTKAMRWGHYSTAARHFRPREPISETKSVHRSVRITAYQVVGTEPNEDSTEVLVNLRLRFSIRETAREYEATERQLWWWDEESSRWYIDGTFPDFIALARRPGRS